MHLLKGIGAVMSGARAGIGKVVHDYLEAERRQNALKAALVAQ